MFNVKSQSVRPQSWMIHAAGTAALAAAGAAFYGLFYAPAGTDNEQRFQRMDQLRSLMTSKEEIAEEHRSLEARLTTLQSAAASSFKRMPRRISSQEFIDKASRLAESLGLQMELCTGSAPQTLPTHSQVEVTCRLIGSYASICRYLAAIDQLPQISKVSRFEVDTAVNSHQYPVNVTFQLYYRGELNDTEQ